MFELPKVKKNCAIEQRMQNIDFVMNLPRENLEYSKNEEILVFDKFNKTIKEELYIQYPGKESVNEKDKSTVKPYDFRPKMLIDGKLMYDLTFQNIWDLIFDLFKNMREEEKRSFLKILSCEFYRIAFMIDYKYTNKGMYIENLNTGERKNLAFGWGLNFYTPNKDIIKSLKEYSVDLNGISWEAFFLYNDLLVLNEDCKYYYSKLMKSNHEEAQKYIKGGIGRTNTMLTYISILGFMMDEIKLTGLLQQFIRGRGVAPITMKKLYNLLDGYLK